MPSNTRRTKAAKSSKENISVMKINVKASNKVLRSTRKALTDKTNSASDDNASTSKSEKPVDIVSSKQVLNKNERNVDRPRRARRLPNRYKENTILKNLSNNNLSTSTQDSPCENSRLKSNLKTSTLPIKPIPGSEVSNINFNNLSPVKKVSDVALLSPIKSPSKYRDNTLIKNRPKRICTLPHKLIDKSISLNKYLKVAPVYASTPLASKTHRKRKENVKKSFSLNHSESVPTNVTPPAKVVKKVIKPKPKGNIAKNVATADSNNNAEQKGKLSSSPRKSPVKKSNTKLSKQNLNKNYSVRLLDDKNNLLKRDSSGLDVYEFTYDPKEELPPIKKKKKTAPKKPPKSKYVVKSTYDKNLAKALAALKHTVSAKSTKTENIKQRNNIVTVQKIINNHSKFNNPNLYEKQNVVEEKKYDSIRVEDIAFDIQPIVEDDNIDYSPVNSPNHPGIPVNNSVHQNLKTNNADPLNLQDNISFFDDQPVASSSINTSVRHPLASPWRVEFNNLPIKWQVNTYVKPNMTPAIESSFINFNDSRNKHVYTNMVPEINDSLPQVVDSVPNLKQTSIISFIKEVIEKSAIKNKGKSMPVKAHSLFEDIQKISANQDKTPKKQIPLKNDNNNIYCNTEISPAHNKKSDIIYEKDYTENSTVTKCSPKKPDENNTYFGFDNSEDLENISPVKKNLKARSLRSRTKGILQEINGQKGPMRAVIPVVTKSKPVQSIVNKVYEELNPASEPPVIQELNISKKNTSGTELSTPDALEFDDSQSVHLFEDIDLIHLYHHKPTRKSYSKAKKVAFHQKPVEYSNDSHVGDLGERVSSDEDNLYDLSFKLPSERPKKIIKKKKPKKQLTKKEEQEVEKWAASFNSMCEDIDEFDLVVE